MIFRHCLGFTTVDNTDNLTKAAAAGSSLFHFLEEFEALNDLAECNVLSVQPWSSAECDEELATVCVAAAVCHGNNTAAVVWDAEVLVLKLWAVYALVLAAIIRNEIAGLAKKAWNDFVELVVLVMELRTRATNALLTGTEHPEILGSAWDFVCKKFNNKFANKRTINGNIKENTWISVASASLAHFSLPC